MVYEISGVWKTSEVWLSPNLVYCYGHRSHDEEYTTDSIHTVEEHKQGLRQICQIFNRKLTCTNISRTRIGSTVGLTSRLNSMSKYR